MTHRHPTLSFLCFLLTLADCVYSRATYRACFPLCTRETKAPCTFRGHILVRTQCTLRRTWRPGSNSSTSFLLLASVIYHNDVLSQASSCYPSCRTGIWHPDSKYTLHEGEMQILTGYTPNYTRADTPSPSQSFRMAKTIPLFLLLVENQMMKSQSLFGTQQYFNWVKVLDVTDVVLVILFQIDSLKMK